jgi:hypothetical protein
MTAYCQVSFDPVEDFDLDLVIQKHNGTVVASKHPSDTTVEFPARTDCLEFASECGDRIRVINTSSTLDVEGKHSYRR